jgi:uncharacterized protein (TIGR03086 family)
VHEVAVLQRAVNEFAGRLDLVAEDQWELPTPCEGWSARHLVGHVTWGSRLAVALLDGATSAQAMASLRPDEATIRPCASFWESADQQAHAFAQENALDRICDHPADRITGRELAIYRAGDITVHAWDLARAIGADETLDPVLVQVALDAYVPWVATLHTDMFGPGPTGDLPSDAPHQQRLLDALGRRT